MAREKDFGQCERNAMLREIGLIFCWVKDIPHHVELYALGV